MDVEVHRDIDIRDVEQVQVQEQVQLYIENESIRNEMTL